MDIPSTVCMIRLWCCVKCVVDLWVLDFEPANSKRISLCRFIGYRSCNGCIPLDETCESCLFLVKDHWLSLWSWVLTVLGSVWLQHFHSTPQLCVSNIQAHVTYTAACSWEHKLQNSTTSAFPSQFKSLVNYVACEIISVISYPSCHVVLSVRNYSKFFCLRFPYLSSSRGYLTCIHLHLSPSVFFSLQASACLRSEGERKNIAIKNLCFSVSCKSISLCDTLGFMSFQLHILYCNQEHMKQDWNLVTNRGGTIHNAFRKKKVWTGCQFVCWMWNREKLLGP